MRLIDTHCHLYSKNLKPDIDAVLERAAHAGLTHILLPAIDRDSHEDMHQLLKLDRPELRLIPMMGVHPCSITENWEEELDIAQRHLQDKKYPYCAVGEIGLDYHWDLSWKEQQILAYQRQVGWAADLGLPVAIHSRKSTQDCIKYLKPFAGRISGVFHCFGGSAEEARESMDLGFYLGIGGVATYNNSNLPELIRELGTERLILETDSPYLPPVPHRGKRNEPAYVGLVAQRLADALEMGVEELAERSTQNALRLFRINH